MVQITPLLSAITVVSHFSPTDSTSNKLAVRQSFNPSSVPSSCQSPCQVVNTMTNCESSADSLDCMCTNTIGSQLETCMNCLVNTEPAVQSEAESAISSWNEACSGNLVLSGGSSSGGTTGGSTGSTTSGTTSGSTGGSTSGTTGSTVTSTTSGGSSSSNPLGAKAGGAVGLKTSGMVVCIVAVLAGAFMSL